jgi:UDP-2-acetamido-3-amino-2,3-dideoxy-glucuronate N-acetyltransferase
MNVKILPSADVDETASIGDGSSVWHLAQVRDDAVLGKNCIIGRGAYVGSGVHIGDNCKLQNYALVYEPAHLEDGVFIGPAAVLTNDPYPRSTGTDGDIKGAEDWQAVGVTVRRGASIGARSVVLGGVTVGSWALIGAGSVVTKDVRSYALVVGNPARQVGWVSRGGFRLEELTPGTWSCPNTNATYALIDGNLQENT